MQKTTFDKMNIDSELKFSKLRTEGNLNMVKNIYKNPTTNSKHS